MPAIPTITLNLKLGTGSSTFPDNFKIEVFEWDINTNTLITPARIELTGITKTQLANPGAGYTLSNIVGTDHTIRTTSTGTCTTSYDFFIYPDALQVYQPITGVLTEEFSGNTDFYCFGTTGGYLSAANVPLGTIKTLSYLDPNDFTISYLSGTTFDGLTVITGDYANGPFSGFYLTQAGSDFTMYGGANTAIAEDPTLSIHGYLRLTYTPSGKYVDFNFWYKPVAC